MEVSPATIQQLLALRSENASSQVVVPRALLTLNLSQSDLPNDLILSLFCLLSCLRLVVIQTDPQSPNECPCENDLRTLLYVNCRKHCNFHGLFVVPHCD
jgi:hypothetical protein